MNDAEYRELEHRLDEALAVFADREAQFSSVVLNARDHLAEVRAEVGAMRADLKRAGVRIRP